MPLDTPLFAGWLEHASLADRGDRTIVLSAVSEDGFSLAFADNALKNDADVVRAAVTNNGLALRSAGDPLKSDKDLVMTAVAQNGLALKFASQGLKSDTDVVLVAMVSNQRTDMRVSTKEVGGALAYAAQELRGDKRIWHRVGTCFCRVAGDQ